VTVALSLPQSKRAIGLAHDIRFDRSRRALAAMGMCDAFEKLEHYRGVNATRSARPAPAAHVGRMKPLDVLLGRDRAKHLTFGSRSKGRRQRRCTRMPSVPVALIEVRSNAVTSSSDADEDGNRSIVRRQPGSPEDVSLLPTSSSDGRDRCASTPAQVQADGRFRLDKRLDIRGTQLGPYGWRPATPSSCAVTRRFRLVFKAFQRTPVDRGHPLVARRSVASGSG